MPYHLHDEETLSRQGLARLQRRKLAALLGEVLDSNSFYRRKFDSVAFDPESDPLDRLPLTTRAEVRQDQLDEPPYGTLLTHPPERYTRLHETSGSTAVPLRWLDTPDSWNWWKRCWGVIYRAAGLTQRDRLLFPFSFGPFIGFWGAFEGAAALGNFVLPGGGMTTTARLHCLLQNQITFVCCTPTYALHMAEVACSEKIDLPASPVRALIVGGEPGGSIPATCARIESGWGARVLDHTGMTEIGPWGFECREHPGGVHIMENEFIAEVIDPNTEQLVDDGEPGELVLTNLGRAGMPLIRYRTGDLVVVTRSRCACGRWFARAEGGIRGRIDDMLFIRGNSVFPSAIEGIVREFDEIAEFRLVVEQDGAMCNLRIDVEPTPQAHGSQSVGLSQRIEKAVRDSLHFKPTVSMVEPGSLPRFEMKAKRVVRG